MTAKKTTAKKRKFALVGFTVSREDAPWGDPEWSVAGCNNLWAQTGMEDRWPLADHWYDLHDLGSITGKSVLNPDQRQAAQAHTEWLRAGAVPCFVMPNVRQPDWPAALDFPRQEILDWASTRAGGRYFTNSVSWMVAHCILTCVVEGYDQGRGGEIGLWGIDMATSGANGEYAAQRPSCEYWLGLAEGLGIEVTVSPRADLLKCGFLYGSEDTDFARKMRERSLELARLQKEAADESARLHHALEVTVARQNQLAGAAENQSYINTVWLQPGGTRQGGDDPSVTARESQPQEA